uniref:TonB C-terminal domain-containing protein n=1 Tax=uncultured gamma proteobacterium HF0010_05D02 TaxID=710978 RepID=E0XQK9_9GAMM|nr:hypothetical protein [uncultured gamma proteobacterium HF0010_05D02]
MKRSFTGLVALLATCTSMYVMAEETDTPVNQEYAPLEKKAPIYPYVTQFNGIEGYCIVEYTVTEQGTVRDVFPDYCTPIGLFEGVSVESAKKFIYQPRIVDGIPKSVSGVQNKFTFDLTGGGKRTDVGDDPIKFSFLKPNEQRSIDKRLKKGDWEGLKKYALGRKSINYRMLFFAGYAELMMGNSDAAYEFIEQFIFHKEEEVPFEYVTFSALQTLVAHYYQSQQYEKLIALDEHVDIWWFRLIEPREVNRMALMIADAYGISGKVKASNKRFKQIVDRSSPAAGTADPFVGMARTALGL